MMNERLLFKRRQRLLSAGRATSKTTSIDTNRIKNHSETQSDLQTSEEDPQVLLRLMAPVGCSMGRLIAPDGLFHTGRRTFGQREMSKLRKMFVSRKKFKNNPSSYLPGPLLMSCVFLFALFTSSPLVHSESSSFPGSRQLKSSILSVHSDKLLKGANVDLIRSESRSLRLQRDTPMGPAEATGTCGYPGSPAHASVTFNTSLVVAGTAASYACDNGYELLGPPRRICQANGTWSPIGIPFCVLNVGLGKAAMQSSTAGGGSAQKAVDGSTSTYFQASTCTMTDVEQSPWWYVNLLEPYLVQIVRIDFGTACCANRQKAMIAVRVGNNRPDLGNNPLCNRYHGHIEEGKPLFLPCTRPAPGAFVSIHLESPSGSSLSICETFIYTDHALSIEQCPSFRDQPLGSTATYNGKCYLFHNNQALNFDGARKYCEHKGGTLVDETSPALQGFLSWELYRRHRNDQMNGQYWLGAVRDARNPQNWKWINGKDVQISFWNSLTSPSNNCSRFDGSKGWLWTDADCSMNYNFICQYRPLSCGKPEKPTNSTLITKNVDNGTIIEYQCGAGSLLMGPKSRACLPTGFFSEFAPKCKYLDCQFPAMIANGGYKLLNGTTSYQSVVNYYCNDGYQLYNKATLTCDVDERWNGPPPRCEPLLCPAPVGPANGYVTVTSNITVPGTLATYDCRPGYELVGDRLLSCLNSGSWDFNFPYCREKRQVALLPSPATSGVAPARNPQRGTTGAGAQGASRPANAIQFPQPAFSPTRIVTPPSQPAIASSASPSTSVASTTQSPAVTASSPTQTASSSPASLNGLAGQFVVSQPAPTNPLIDSMVPGGVEQQPANRKLNGGNQFAVASPPPPPAPPAQPSSIGQANQELGSTSGSNRFRPNSFGNNREQQQPQFVSPPSMPTSSTGNPSSQSTTSRQQTTSASSAQPSTNKFSFAGANQPTGTTSGTFDSSTLATTNSISLQHNAGHTSPTQSGSTSTTTMASTSVNPSTSSLANSNTLLAHNQLGGPSVLSSFGNIRSHNSLASARYSLDGIIAVAIFGGFIFLGAIITIIVIIIRRRQSSHSSSIDAQTISTYDSNGGEHNGLYRNYQQAWENLRFATPSSQPKSSGVGVGLISGAGAPVGLKNMNPNTAMMQHLHHSHQLHGHHNMAMAHGSTSSSQSSSSLGGAKGLVGLGPGEMGVDPLLRHSHHNVSNPNHHHHHHHHHHRRSHHPDQVDGHHHGHHHHHGHRIQHAAEPEDLTSQDEQGVLSSDEAVYHLREQHAEGFRDSNELTINADTHVLSSQGVGAARRRIYNGNNGSVAATNRISTNLSLGSDHNHHHHHHSSSSSHHHSSQHQRLVSSSTPSESTRSSRASPPSDDHSLDRLAYGNGWLPNANNNNNNNNTATSNNNSGQQQHQADSNSAASSSNNNSAGSGASILGGGAGRTNGANIRY